MKFGGSILSSKEDLQRIAMLVKERREKEEICAVVSALKGVTDLLIQASEEAINGDTSIKKFLANLREMHLGLILGLEKKEARIEATKKLNEKLAILEKALYGINYLGELSERSKAVIYTFGERLSAILLEGYLVDAGLDTCLVEANEVIVTDSCFSTASPDMKKTAGKAKELGKMLKENTVVVTGYLAADEAGIITCLGRGGSDFSAGILANVLDADSLELWKDVDGFMSADPKAVKEAVLLTSLSYEEAEELGYFGAKILHPRTILPLREKGIKAVIKNILKPGVEGTVISDAKEEKESIVKSIATQPKIAVICLKSAAIVGKPGALSHIFSSLAKEEISVDLVATSETGLSLTIMEKDGEKAVMALENCPIEFDSMEIAADVAMIGLIGEGLKKRAGIAGRLFTCLGNEGINVETISQGGSEANISFIVKEESLEKAVKAIHSEFM